MQSNHGKRRSALLGVAAVCAALITAAGSASAAPTEGVLYAFKGGSDGALPLAGLIADSSGNLYGTTVQGGTTGCFGPGIPCGVVFKLAPGGTETVLHAFTGGTDGWQPVAGLIADSSGNLYGTTENGGGGPCGGPVPAGCGTVFKLTPGGSETVLHAFCLTNCSDGANPSASLIADSSGNLYGTTGQGGAHGAGVVFKLSPGGTETVLYAFKGGSDGAGPGGGLLADSGGNLFGTAGGGAHGAGVVFKLAPGGTETVLYAFKGGSDGANPSASLIADSSGNLYGTAAGGGSGNGVVFKLSPGGTYTVLYSFKGGSDGATPLAVLIADSAGNLYGTTNLGGAPGPACGLAQGCGVVFKVSPGGTETVLYSFCSLTNCSDGGQPHAGLIADGRGNLYGTTFDGGESTPFCGGCGTVFKLAGTGFVPSVPFLAFNAALAIRFGAGPNQDAFALETRFILSSTAPALAEPVTLQIGTFAVTIPPGSFKKTTQGFFVFAGVINGVGLEAALEPTGTLQYAFQAQAVRANLTGTKNPVTVTLTIGRDTGTTSVNADIR